MPRLFTAVEIPATIAQRLSMLRARIDRARWIDPENYHLTLRFIGDVDVRTANDFANALARIDAEPFDLAIGGVGCFGGRKPRALWAGVTPDPALDRLKRANDRAARAAGLPDEARNFSPHITLARLRGTRPQTVAGYLEDVGGFAATPFTVERFVLYSSRDSVGGGPYVVEEAYSLGAQFDDEGDDEDGVWAGQA